MLLSFDSGSPPGPQLYPTGIGQTSFDRRASGMMEGPFPEDTPKFHPEQPGKECQHATFGSAYSWALGCCRPARIADAPYVGSRVGAKRAGNDRRSRDGSQRRDCARSNGAGPRPEHRIDAYPDDERGGRLHPAGSEPGPVQGDGPGQRIYETDILGADAGSAADAAPGFSARGR